MVVYAMASIRARSDNNLLFFDFRFKGVRCREQTSLQDNKCNRIKLEKVLKAIEAEIADNTFDYRRYFPQSKLAQKFDLAPMPSVLVINKVNSDKLNHVTGTPIIKVFCEQWYLEMSVGWRRSYKYTVRQIIDSRIIPEFGNREVSSIRREDILTFRSSLAKDTGRKKDSTISPRRINAIILVLKQILLNCI